MLGDLRGIALALKAGIAESAGLRPGQTFQTTVRADVQGTPFIRVGGQYVTLPAGGAWTTGQPVQLSVSGDASALRIEVSPAPAATPTAPIAGTATPAAQPALSALSRLIGTLMPGLAVEDAAALLPSQLPATPAAVGPLLQLLVSAKESASAWNQVLQFLAGARQAGRLSGKSLSAADVLLALQQQSPEEMPESLRLLVQGAATEARLAQGAPPPAPMDLRSALALLLDDDSLKAFQSGQGTRTEFEHAAKALLSRLDAIATANLHGLDRAYAFLEIPAALLPGFQRAQVHVFSESEGKSSPRKPPATVVLDLALDTLGDLWIQLRRDAVSCICEIAADREETRALIEASRDDLVGKLSEAGLPHPAVRVIPWRAEERVARLSALIAPPKPLDVGA